VTPNIPEVTYTGSEEIATFKDKNVENNFNNISLKNNPTEEAEFIVEVGNYDVEKEDDLEIVKIVKKV